MPSLLPIGGSIRLNASVGGAATVMRQANGGFAAPDHVSHGLDVFTLCWGASSILALERPG
jgi:hypothetical protein